MRYIFIILSLLLCCTKTEPQNQNKNVKKDLPFISDDFAIVNNQNGLDIYEKISDSSKIINNVQFMETVETVKCYTDKNNIKWCKIRKGDIVGYVKRKGITEVSFFMEKTKMPKKLLNEYHIGVECDGYTNSEWTGVLYLKKNIATYTEKNHTSTNECVNSKGEMVNDGYNLTINTIYKGSYKMQKDHIVIKFNEYIEEILPSDNCVKPNRYKSKKRISKEFKMYPVICYCYGKKYNDNFIVPGFKDINLIFGKKGK